MLEGAVKLFYLFPPGSCSSSLPCFFLLSFVSFPLLLLFSVSSLQPPFVPCHSDRVLCVCVCQDQRKLCVSTEPVTFNTRLPPQPANMSNPTTPPRAHIRSSSSHLQHRLPFPNTGTPHHPPLQKYPTRGKFKSTPTLLPPLMALGFRVLQLVVVLYMCFNVQLLISLTTHQMNLLH